jgi:hypothetical protein
LSDDRDDLELQALQRELDDAFETTRPRPGFEDRLWLKLQARRPFWIRMRDGLVGLGGAVRELPALPAATVAVVLIVAVGLGVLALGGSLHPASRQLSEAGSAAVPADHANQGRLPTPVLHPGLIDTGVSAGATYQPNAVGSSAAPSNVYYGPANLSWTGTFPTAAVQAPVLSYGEPGLAEADQFAGSLGASTSKQVRAVNGFLGTYAGQDFVISVRGSVPQLPREPFFVLTPSNPSGSAAADPTETALALLSTYSLLPSWPYSVAVVQSNGLVRVLLEREFKLPDGASANFVDWNGERYGLEVDLSNGKPVQAVGQLPLNLTSNDYRLISNEAAASAALSSKPAGTAVISPTPTVALDKVELVYALAIAGGQGYYEPAYLFSGTFRYNGQAYVKRVLVPLVDPSLRS